MLVATFSQQFLYFPYANQSLARMDADTRLVAAAPEMYLILQTALSVHRAKKRNTYRLLTCAQDCWCFEAERILNIISPEEDGINNEEG